MLSDIKDTRSQQVLTNIILLRDNLSFSWRFVIASKSVGSEIGTFVETHFTELFICLATSKLPVFNNFSLISSYLGTIYLFLGVCNRVKVCGQ